MFESGCMDHVAVHVQSQHEELLTKLPTTIFPAEGPPFHQAQRASHTKQSWHANDAEHRPKRYIQGALAMYG